MKKLLPVAVLAALSLARCGSSSNESGDGDGGSSTGASSGAHGGSSSGASKKDAGHSNSSSSGGGSSSGTPSGSSSGSPSDDSGAEADAIVYPACKRGVASTIPPGQVFLPTAQNPGVTWWYNWSNEPSPGAANGLEYTPMIWGTGSLMGPIPQGAKFLMGFNEPNFANQSNMTAAEAASKWPQVEALAQAQGIPIVSPGMNFCGSASDPSNCADPSVTDPYTYLKEFFADCPGCEVDYISVHWYNCDVPSLQAYIEGNATLEGFLQFGKPIWVTEFACDNSHSPADQQAYMEAAITYLENNDNVYRYSWFSATNIPNAMLTNSDGSLTDLGVAYVSAPQNCL